MNDDDCKNDLLHYVVSLLRQTMYEFRINGDVVEVERVYQGATIKIKISPDNCTDVSFKAGYLVMPKGKTKIENEKILSWYTNITSRTDLGAGIGLDREKRFILVHATARLNKGRRGDLGELIYRIFSVLAHYKCHAYDTEEALKQGFRLSLE